MTRDFVHMKDGCVHEFIDLPFSLSIDDRSHAIMFVNGICRSCGYHSNKHRLVLAKELTTEWQICATEQIHFTTSAPIETRYICIRKEEQEEYMTREEFEELYNGD